MADTYFVALQVVSSLLKFAPRIGGPETSTAGAAEGIQQALRTRVIDFPLSLSVICDSGAHLLK